MGCLDEIGLSRKQRVFVVTESVCGTIQYPNATTDFVRPAGDAKINQTPAFVDSEEKMNTLDVLDRFQNVMPAGEWELPMYIRTETPSTPTASFATPQGGPLFESLQGVLSTGTSGTLNADLALVDTLIHADCTACSSLPNNGVIRLACAQR